MPLQKKTGDVIYSKLPPNFEGTCFISKTLSLEADVDYLLFIGFDLQADGIVSK